MSTQRPYYVRRKPSPSLNEAQLAGGGVFVDFRPGPGPPFPRSARERRERKRSHSSITVLRRSCVRQLVPGAQIPP